MSTIIKGLLRCCIAICICLIWNQHVLSQELEIKVFNKEYEQCKTDFDPIGTHCRWHKNGQLARKAIYNMGLKISERLYDKAGNLIDK